MGSSRCRVIKPQKTEEFSIKKRRVRSTVSLFPFLTILLATMGILAFIGLSLLFSAPEKTMIEANSMTNPADSASDTVLVEFQLIGKPASLYPHYILCRNEGLTLIDDNLEIPFSEEWGYFVFLSYLYKLQETNIENHRNYQDHQEYIIFAVYAGGIETYQKARQILQQYSALNFGVEPMLPNWKIADLKSRQSHAN